MRNDEIVMIRAIIKALHVPRNRYGKLDGDSASSNEMSAIIQSLGSVPHGGLDCVDQACMILQHMVGDVPKSIMDEGKR